MKIYFGCLVLTDAEKGTVPINITYIIEKLSREVLILYILWNTIIPRNINKVYQSYITSNTLYSIPLLQWDIAMPSLDCPLHWYVQLHLKLDDPKQKKYSKFILWQKITVILSSRCLVNDQLTHKSFFISITGCVAACIYLL